MIVFLLFLIGLGIVATQIRKPRLFIALTAGYAINLALIFTQRYVRPIFYSSDQQRFVDLANELAAMDFFSFLLQFDPTGSYLISWFAALIFKVLGSDLLYVNFFFVYAWVGTIAFSCKLSTMITGNKNISFLIVLFVIFTPSVSIVNAAFLRESFIIFFLVVSVYYSYQWYLSKNLHFFIKSIIFMTLAGFFHGAFYFLCVILVLFYMKESLLKLRVRYLDLFFVFALVPLFAVASIKLADNVKVKMAFSLIAGDERSVERFLTSTEDRSSYEGINRLQLPDIDGSNAVSFITSLARRVAAFSSSPFIQHYSKVTDIPRIYDSLVFVFACVLCFLIYKDGRRYDDKRIKFYFKLFIPMMLLVMLMFSLGSFDVGTSQRHRLKFMPVFMVVTFSMYYVSRSLYRINRQRRVVGG
ncbi:hypothetical protein [Stutzerimonas stutzeri]|uniref:hypothetical protein n=1 Tax=Stutzerimonas stutzeri TaxID=316 RepID=UPI0015E353DC|nr:hypothetical protein [Stutzerimonas stutzeri]MBA1277433.1 hypothetical protein [Stutzerimonas stutzeri]